MTRRPGELPEPEEQLLGIERQTPEQEAEAEKRRKEESEVRRRYITNLLANPLFRDWMLETLNTFGTFDNQFGATPTGFPDPLATQFKLGMKAAGWHLWALFDELSPEGASLMRRKGGSL